MPDNKCDDQYLFNLWLSRYHLASVAVADTLGVFKAIADGNTSTQQIACTLNLDLSGVEALTCLLASLNLLVKQENHINSINTVENYLLPHSEIYWGEVFTYTHNTLEYKVLLNALQSKAINESTQMSNNGTLFHTMWSNGEFDEDAARKFRNIMHATIYTPAIKAVQSGVFKNSKHLLDVGGCSGCFATQLIKVYPEKTVTIFDLPQMCNLTREYLKKEGVMDKIALCSGNFFIDKFPKFIDSILFSNILHDWQKEQAQFLINKAYDALPSRGQIFIYEILLNENRNGSLNAATFNLFMYANYKSQQFTKSELFNMLKIAGFSKCIVHRVHQDYSIISGIK